MIISPLSLEEIAKNGYHKYAVVAGADIAALGAVTTGTITIAKPIPAEVFGPVAIHVQAQFTSSDGTLANLTVSVGDAGSATRYLGASEILNNSFSAGYSSNTTFSCLTSPTTSVILTFAATATKLLNTVTGGQLVVFWASDNLASMDAEVSNTNLVELTEPVS
jgi:hypothetical protein